MFELVEDNNMNDVASSLIVKSGALTKDSNLTAEEGDKSDIKSDDISGLALVLLGGEEPVDDNDSDDEENAIATISDDAELEVMVDGQPALVSLKDLKASWSGNKAIARRLQENVEAKRVLEATAQHLNNSLSIQKTRLAQIDAVLKQITEAPMDWAKLKVDDPARYLLERDRVREAQERRDLVAKEATRVDTEQAQLHAQALEMYADDQAKALAEALPDLRDEVKGKIITEGFVRAGQVYGYKIPEIQNVMDHRAFLVLNDARKYQDLVALANKKKKAAEPKQVKTLLRTGGGASVQPGTRMNKVYEARVKKAQETGSVDDVALTLLVPKKANGR